MKQTHSILDQIIKDKQVELETLKQKSSLTSLQEAMSLRATPVRDFSGALSKKPGPRLMAEIKKASPSAGIIRQDFDPIAIAKEYEQSGVVDAISLLTESKYFLGNLAWISEIKSETTMPIFRKDFIFDMYQIYEAYVAEADALLLIAAVLEETELKQLLDLTHTLGMNALVETHSVAEVYEAINAGARIIGINARDLATFHLDTGLFEKLAPLIPPGLIKVAESSLENKSDIERVASAGADAVLIGSSIMKSHNITKKLFEIAPSLGDKKYAHDD